MSWAHLLAAHTRESGAWLNALPVSALGLCMDDDTVHVAMGLRLGAPLCLPHVCHHCGAEVGKLGTHGLSCHKSQGRHPRHASINSLIQRHLSAAGIPAHLEPTGLCRSDGKRPDGTDFFNHALELWSGSSVGCYMPRNSGPIPYCFGFQRARFGGRTGRTAEEDQVCGPADHTPLRPHWHLRPLVCLVLKPSPFSRSLVVTSGPVLVTPYLSAIFFNR